ncbi:hypothetical protein [Dysgonomonas sp. 25]|uniref:hypothetical protein n=1 Tax=Dysgonomonas sp. 25 TaxID=2302933 RepID=UPI0013D1F0F1|nr:hypothetical protein [Dysgonomonas sp. 25]NDV69278.1 hypothetical protein [Dysgonomonas sp. 25]
MANEKINPVRLSELPEINMPEGFWVFGSKEDTDGSFQSGRYSLDNLLEYAKRLPLERRLSFTIGSSESPQMYIDESMTIYQIGVKDVYKLSIDVEGTSYDIALDSALSVDVPAKSVITLNATPVSTDTQKMFVFIYAKAIIA